MIILDTNVLSALMQHKPDLPPEYVMRMFAAARRHELDVIHQPLHDGGRRKGGVVFSMAPLGQNIVRVGCSQSSGYMAFSKTRGKRLHFITALGEGHHVKVRPSVLRESVFELRTSCKAAVGMGKRGCLVERHCIGTA